MKKMIFGFCILFGPFLYAQQTEYVDFIKLNARITVVPDSSKVVGRLKYRFKILKDIDSVFIDAADMVFSDVLLNDSIVGFTNDKKKLWLKSSFKADNSYAVSFTYKVKPKKALYFLKRNDDWNIWTQGQGKYTSNWLPSFDDVNEKVEFDLSYIFYGDYEVLSNGDKVDNEYFGSLGQWFFDSKKPMSSYLVALAIGKYDVKTETSNSGIPLEYYYYPEDSLKVEPTYRYTKQMFDFLENEIGFAYPWQNYKKCLYMTFCIQEWKIRA